MIKNCKPDRAGGDAHAGDADAPGAADYVLHGPTHQGCQQSYTASIQNLVPGKFWRFLITPHED